jgi:hypothetical protein
VKHYELDITSVGDIRRLARNGSMSWCDPGLWFLFDALRYD